MDRRQIYLIIMDSSEHPYDLTTIFTQHLPDVAHILAFERSRVFEFPQMKEVTQAEISIQ